MFLNLGQGVCFVHDGLQLVARIRNGLVVALISLHGSGFAVCRKDPINRCYARVFIRQHLSWNYIRGVSLMAIFAKSTSAVARISNGWRKALV
jgi:hypothetical protein